MSQWTRARRGRLKKGRSLLPSGITDVSGTFVFGDAVSVEHDGVPFARGLANYSSHALQKIKGKQTGEIASVLGYKDYDEVIHRDNLVIVG